MNTDCKESTIWISHAAKVRIFFLIKIIIRIEH